MTYPNNWDKHRQARLRQLRAIGTVFLALALLFSSYAYLAYAYPESASQQQACYMISAMLVCMAAFCLSAVK